MGLARTSQSQPIRLLRFFCFLYGTYNLVHQRYLLVGPRPSGPAPESLSLMLTTDCELIQYECIPLVVSFCFLSEQVSLPTVPHNIIMVEERLNYNGGLSRSMVSWPKLNLKEVDPRNPERCTRASCPYKRPCGPWWASAS